MVSFSQPPKTVQLRQQFWGHQKSQLGADTAENVCVMTCHSHTGGVGLPALQTFCCLWRSKPSLDLQPEVKLVAPLWPWHETARGFSSLFWVEEIRKVNVWHHEDVSAQNSKQNSLEILVHIPLASCMSVATATNSSLWAGLICFPSAVYNPLLAQPNLPRYHCVLGMGVVDENWARHHMWRANYSDPKTVNIHENGKIRMNRAQGSIFSYQTYNLHWSEGEAE